MIRRSALLDALVANGDIDEAQRAAIQQRDADVAARYDGPWYLQALTIFGAWLGSLFMVGFMLIFTGGNQGGLALLGALLMGVASASRERRGLFVSQFAMAVAFSGQIVLVSGLSDYFKSMESAVVVSIVACAALYAVWPDPRQRFLSPLLPAAIAVIWACVDKERRPALNLVAIVEVGLAWLALAGPPRPALRPLGISMIFALCGTFLTMQFLTTQAAAQLAMTLALLWLLWRISGGFSPLAVIGAILLGVASSPGVVFGICLLVLGFARGDRFIGSLGCVFLALFLSLFYYNLEATLAAKSGILIGTGAIILLARAGLARNEDAA